jgi:nitrogen fixation NifU-like protein
MSYSNLEQLYRQIIMDHYKSPKNKGLVEGEHYHKVHLRNPSCGDDITVQTLVEDGVVTDVHHDGEGCSICCSSASMMSVLVKNKKVEDALEIKKNYENMLFKKEYNQDLLDDANSLVGVSNLPPRIKCASIAWQAFEKSLDGDEEGEINE